MPFVGAEVKDGLRRIEATVTPDLIFTHNRKDAHQDHRLISELTWNTFRDHLILEYEIPKYDGDMGQPSVFRSARGRGLPEKSSVTSWTHSNLSTPSDGLSKRRFFRSCVCEGWNAMLPAVMPKLSTAARSCCKLKRAASHLV